VTFSGVIGALALFWAARALSLTYRAEEAAAHLAAGGMRPTYEHRTRSMDKEPFGKGSFHLQ
jgi:hypothetical protein